MNRRKGAGLLLGWFFCELGEAVIEFVEGVGGAGAKFVFGEGFPALAVVFDDVGQAAVGGSAGAHLDPKFRHVLGANLIDFDEAQQQIPVGTDGELGVEVAEFLVNVATSEKSRVG